MTVKYYTCDSLFKSFSVVRNNGWEYRVVFAHNNTHRKGEFITEDAELQALIEKRPEFKKGSIRLVNTVVTEDEIKVEHVDVIPKAEVAAPAKLSTVEEVTTWNEAKDYLKAKGVHHLKLKTPQAITAEAEKLNIIFTNIEG